MVESEQSSNVQKTKAIESRKYPGKLYVFEDELGKGT